MHPLVTPRVIAIVGPANSGKTSLGRAIGSELQAPALSLSSLVREFIEAHLADRNIKWGSPPCTRQAIEQAFDSFVNQNGYEPIIRRVLRHTSTASPVVVVDGFRHATFLKALRRELGAENLLAVGIKLSPKQRYLLAQRRSSDASGLRKDEALQSFEDFRAFEKGDRHERAAQRALQHCDLLVGQDFAPRTGSTDSSSRQAIEAELKSAAVSWAQGISLPPMKLVRQNVPSFCPRDKN